MQSRRLGKWRYRNLYDLAELVQSALVESLLLSRTIEHLEDHIPYTCKGMWLSVFGGCRFITSLRVNIGLKFSLIKITRLWKTMTDSSSSLSAALRRPLLSKGLYFRSQSPRCFARLIQILPTTETKWFAYFVARRPTFLQVTGPARNLFSDVGNLWLSVQLLWACTRSPTWRFAAGYL